jgi:methyl-accepting chemotaxis protein
MDKVVQSNAASAEESASAAEELNAQADAMKDSVDDLLQLINGARANAQPAATLPPARVSKQTPQSSSKGRTISSAPVKPTVGNNGHHGNNGHNGNNGHTLALKSKRAEAIPMGDDFKDF